ncbi:MAG: hypothetical protein LC802_06600 [Acidobacteria bacterium]|nr:hypothetical protein [Acidobacteriota bacterium]
MSRNANGTTSTHARGKGRGASPTSARARGKSRTSLYLSLVAVAVVIGLLWQEQIALLYVLATLSVAGLLAVVAFADLRGTRQGAAASAPFDDSAAIADGRAGATSSKAFGSTAPRATVKRPRKR